MKYKTERFPTGYFWKGYDEDMLEAYYNTKPNGYKNIEDLKKEIDENIEWVEHGCSPAKIFKINKITITIDYEHIEDFGSTYWKDGDCLKDEQGLYLDPKMRRSQLKAIEDDRKMEEV